MEYTKNYHLPQWAEEDRILMADFNGAMAALEQGITENKASADAKIAVVDARVGSGGRTCRIAYGTYVGTGTYGPANPTSLTFPFRPLWVLIATGAYGFDDCQMMRPITGAYSADNSTLLTVQWEEKKVIWWNDPESINAFIGQNNTTGKTYYYIALGYDE